MKPKTTLTFKNSKTYKLYGPLAKTELCTLCTGNILYAYSIMLALPLVRTVILKGFKPYALFIKYPFMGGSGYN